MSLTDVKQFLDEHDTCVLATVNIDGKPQAASVGYSVDGEFNFLIGTNKNTRKYQNLKNSNKVALVVGFSGSKTVQIEGCTKELSIEDRRVQEHLDKVPSATKFKLQDGQTYFLIAPTWLRSTDYSAKNQIFETKDFV